MCKLAVATATLFLLKENTVIVFSELFCRQQFGAQLRHILNVSGHIVLLYAAVTSLLSTDLTSLRLSFEFACVSLHRLLQTKTQAEFYHLAICMPQLCSVIFLLVRTINPTLILIKNIFSSHLTASNFSLCNNKLFTMSTFNWVVEFSTASTRDNGSTIKLISTKVLFLIRLVWQCNNF